MLHHFLESSDLSYLVGLLQSDGHHQANTRNRGKITVELQVGDRALLQSLQALLPVYSSVTERTRDTNLKTGATSCIWSVFDREVREELRRLGVPVGRKSETIAPPQFEYSAPDYFRGLMDGDGSLGLTARGYPFVSLTTKSEAIAQCFVAYIARITGKVKRANRNKRDAMFNLMVLKEDAQILAKLLYEGSAFRLERKFSAYRELMRWVRPSDMAKRGSRKWWSPEQDEYVLNHPVEDAAMFLGRSRTAIQMRRYRLSGRFLYARKQTD